MRWSAIPPAWTVSSCSVGSVHARERVDVTGAGGPALGRRGDAGSAAFPRPSIVGPAGVAGRHLPAGGCSATPCLLGDVGEILLAPGASTGSIWRHCRSPAYAEFLASSSFGADAELLYRTTGGNPFYLTEVVATAVGSLPGTIRDAVLAHAARLSPSASRALSAAAVLGQRADAQVIATIAGEPMSAVDECIRNGLLVADG